MKLPILLISLATLSSSSSLLELSQVLWSRVLGGGYRNVGTLDPLRVPVIKVDQSEGNASYRVILRDLEVTGLNGSTIESVNIVRGKLKSNLSDGEAGYVSYNEQHDLDSIRYRFHTLIKEPKSAGAGDAQGSASETAERIVEYDPMYTRAREEEDLFRAASQNSQRRNYGSDDVETSRRGAFQQQTYNRTYQSNYGDMRVVMNSTPRSPASVRVAYTHNYRNAQDDNVRPCIGACRPNYAQEYAERRGKPVTQQGPFPADDGASANYQSQRYSDDRVADSEKSGAYAASGQFGASGFSGEFRSGPQRPGATGQQRQFSVITGIPSADAQGAASSNYEVKAPANSGFSAQYQNQPGVKGGVKGGSEYQGAASSNYEVKSQGNGNYGFSAQYQNQPGVKGGVKGGSEYQGAASSNYEVKSQGNGNYGSSSQYQNQPGVKGGVKGASEYQGAASSNYEVKSQGNGNYGSSSQYQNQPGVKGGSEFQGAASDNYEVKTQGNPGSFSAQYQNQPGVKGGLKGSSNGQYPGAIGQRPSQFSAQAGQPGDAQGAASDNYEVKAQYGGSGFEATNSGVKGASSSGVNYSANYRNGQLNIQSQTGNNQRFGVDYESSDRKDQPSIYFRGSTSRPTSVTGEYNDQERRYQATQGGRFPTYTTASSATVEQFEPYKAPMIRLEKQPGYVDVVYARERQQGGEDTLKTSASNVDSRVYGLEEIMKELEANQRYIIHNFTQGESLSRRNDAARTAVESRRIKDLIRYAKEYQEKQGYFEEGMEFIYHFGDLNETVNDSQTNETLTRRKRQHTDDKEEEEEVMHVVVRVRVPMLGVRANYGLLGKVGRQPVRGSGVLAGNFTDVIGDFTVELKKVDNKTMIVRAARAKLVAKDRNVKLQGMDEKGPVSEILSQGLLAAEAVAAMIADDLASKALSEGNADGMIYKMYKNLPVIEKS